MKIIFLIILGQLLFCNIYSQTLVESSQAGNLKSYIISSNSDNYIDDWKKIPSSESINLPNITEYKIWQTSFISFIVTGFETSVDSSFHLIANVRFTNPKSEVLLDQKSFSTLKGKINSTNSLVMFDQLLEFTFDNTDPFGNYLIELEVIDKINNKICTQKKDISLRETIMPASSAKELDIL